MGNTHAPTEQPYPDFTGMTGKEKVDAMIGYVVNSSSKKMVTLPEPVVFIHENGQTSTLG